MYAHRSSPSFSKVVLRLFAVVSLIFLAYFSYSTFAEHDEIKERLYELGYPTEGFIFTNGTIRWADGHLTIVQGAYVEDYSITAEQAYEIARNYLASYNEKLKEYDYKIYPDKKTLTEKEKNGQRYWVFELKLDTGGSKLFAGFIWVNRKTGAVSVKGLLG
ncbi:hypothetical protein OCC_02862 [Thermococcus litoralis DSM 5473]|uniref:PepSY domain-containing protein n=1 Tax=Thermococcus litoralis (strain ATCC 51850 / DSM 5473 / JCM 8560 / NS-C) TaxID=523849 RepID=H3ZPZ4_THELN|nr:hypothetical protein [Thermococcus litoralis]EHR77957.1 hypothetical protein OCC_02862 [Thermococcus litoralis DSM 5473]